MKHAITPAARYQVQRLPPKLGASFLTAAANKGTCIVIHGWNSDGDDMQPLRAALQALPSAAGWTFYCPTYDTHFSTFVEAANALYPLLNALQKPLIIVGYSEGGIVARQLIVDGMQVEFLVTICSPHQGLLPWIPTPDLGSGSVSPFSEDLSRLNASPVDQENRSDYYLFGMTSTDLFGAHADDGVVAIASALGFSLGDVAQRSAIELDYGDEIAGWDPHEQGMNPARLDPVLATCSQLFA